MPLTTGQSLTHYEILGPLGAGGMGEVYRARDTRLEREVAIKVLPEELADDEERLRRFEREAKTLASLNHPNVAGIHGVDHQGDVYFLALELVPGEDLATRLARGPLPVDEAIDVCRQIAEALKAAHEAGVIHRDLKPANVRLTAEGAAKILDFGLAKPVHPKAGKEGTTSAESDSFLMTEEGLVLGTPTYMSPEQARGKQVDRRTDIWAFGCVLYECLTGQRAFRGGSLTDILAAIVGEEPDLSLLPRLPASVRALLLRCLKKDPRVRLRDIGEARVLLQSGDLKPSEGQPAQARRSRAALFVAGGVVLGAVLGGLVLDGMRAESESSVERATSTATVTPVRRFAQPPALDSEGAKVPWIETFLSPQGRHLAVTTADGLVVRSLDSLESTRIPDTEATGSRSAAGSVAWSPDGEYLAYIDGTSILRVTPQGHSPVPLYSLPDDSAGLRMIAWLDDGRIVFGSAGNAGVRLHSIPERGGPATEVAVVSDSMIDGHLHGITAVPGGRFITVLHKFLGDDYTVLTEGESGLRTLFSLPGEHIPMVRWVPGDYLLFGRGPDEAFEMWAVPLSMDPFEVTGEPIFVQGGAKSPSVSMDGTLAYVEQKAGLEHQLAWWSPDGTTERFGRTHDRAITAKNLSNEQGSILYATGTSLPMELWKYDLRRGISTEVATGPDGGLWGFTLPDGRIAYASFDSAAGGMSMKSYLLPATGRGEPEPWLDSAVLDATESHALVALMQGSGMDLYVDDLTSHERREFRVDDDLLGTGSISPDGDWAIFSRGSEVLLTRFPSGEGEWLVSTEGGREAAFSPDGSSIHVVSDQKLFSVSLRTEPEVELGAPQLVGQAQEGTRLSAASEGGSGRFLATHTLGAVDGDLVIVLGWASELAGR